MSSLVLLVLIACCTFSSVTAADVNLYWNITYVNFTSPTNVTRTAIGLNNTYPPLPVIVNSGDVLRIHATNSLSEPTTLHSHGMYFNATSYMDGAIQVTQCGIPPGSLFTYVINTTVQTGTYWIHAHAHGHYVDGLRMSFVILPPKDTKSIAFQSGTQPFDEEFTIHLADWYNDQHSDLMKKFLWKGNPGGAEPVPESSLMYISQNGTYLPGFGDDTVLPFKKNRSYKLRVINMSALSMFQFYIDNHTMEIIEADGVDIEPYQTDILTVTVAQRYSILVKSLSNDSTNFAIHANLDPEMFDGVPDTLQLNITGTLEYRKGAERSDPQLLQIDAIPPLRDQDFVPLQKQVLDTRTPDVELDFNVFFDTYDNGNNRASFNNLTYSQPKVPTILSTLSMGNDSQNPVIYGAMTGAVVIPHMALVQFKVINWDAGHHPFHLHGHKIQIVHRSYDVTSNDTSVNPPFDNAQTNPSRRDVFAVPSGGSTTVRFIADNPGVWLMHCHIEWHLESGLAVTFIEAPLEAQKKLSPPDYLIDQCKQQGISTSGNAVGKLSATDLSGQILGPYPIIMGWTATAKGVIASCIIAALIGIATVIWYALGEISDEHVIAEEEFQQNQKQMKKEAKLSPNPDVVISEIP